MDSPTVLKMDRFRRIQGGTLIIENKHKPIFKGINTVGRNRVAVINIKNLNVSQNQALIILIDETQHYISDLNSSNGTFLQNTKLTPFKLYELTNNAEITFGDVGAVYKKILSSDTTINLQETLDVTEMTQNMTQNFYASDTQVFGNNKDGNGHHHSIEKQLNTNPLSIHEIQTQVQEYPSFLPPPLTEQSSQAVTEEIINTDIHDAPTQIVTYSNTNITKESNSKNFPNLENQEENGESISSNSNTQIITVEEREAIVNRINTENSRMPGKQHSPENQQNVDKPIEMKTNVIHYSQEPSTSGLGTFFKECDDSFLSTTKITETNDLVVEESITENNNSNDSIDFLDVDNTQNEMKVNNKYPTSPTHSESSEESDIIFKSKNSVLKLPNTQTDDETDADCTQDIVKQRKKPISKLPDTQIENQSSLDDTQDIGFRKKSLKPITEDSDTENDVLDVQENSSAKLPLTNGEKTAANSDSDTDCEDILIHKASATTITRKQSTSDDDTDIENSKKCDLDDTDCIPATQDAFSNGLEHKPTKSSQLSTHHSSEESFKLGLTELMSFSQNYDENVELHKASESNLGKVIEKEKEESAIKPTSTSSEDPMSKQAEGLVKKFVFKKKSAYLDDSLTTILSTNRNSNKNENTKTENINEKNIEQPTETIDDDVFLQPTELDTSSTTNFSTNRNSKKNENNKTENITKSNEEQPAETIDDVFLQPTQLDTSSTTDLSINTSLIKNGNTETDKINKNNEEQPNQTIDDIFLQPTQLDTSSSTNVSMDTDLNKNENTKTENINENKEERPNETIDDVFLQPTQLDTFSTTIDENKEQSAQKIDDVFLQPTQSINPTESESDIFLQPTQSLNSDDEVFLKPNLIQRKTQNIDDDLFLHPTQLLSSTETCNSKPTDSCTQDDFYLTSTQVIQEKTDGKSKDVSMTQEDLYGQETQKIEDIPDLPQALKTQSEKEDVFMLSTQKISDNCEDATETQLELHYLNETMPIPVESNRPANPLLRELDKEESQEMSTENKSSVKEEEVDKHSQKANKLQSENLNDSVETLSQIEAFLKKPLPPRKSARHLVSKEQVTTTKKSLDKSILNKSKKPIERADRVETLSQIVAFVSESNPKQVPNKCQNQSTKEVDMSTSGKDLNTKAQPPKEDTISKQFSNESMEDSDEEFEKIDSSREIRSDVDQSFALLQSKSSKIRRKHPNDPVLEEIKVIVTSHRKSMSIAENDKPELIIPIKKSKRITSSSFTNVTEAKQPPKLTRTRKSNLQSTIVDQTHADNKPTSSNTEISDDITTSKESLPENSKNRKLSTTNEQKSTRCRKLKEDDCKVARTRKSKLSSASGDNGDVKNTNSTTNAATKRKNESTEAAIKPNNNPINLKNSNSINTKKSAEESSEEDMGLNNIKHNRRMKRTINSSEDTSDPPTPAKHTRISRKMSCIASEESSSNNSPETSRYIETTPKKNQTAPKTDSLLSSGERSKRKLKPKVVFTMLDSPKLESYIRHLGGSIVDNVDSATVLMTESVKRSQKLLTAVAQGKPICPPTWINESVKNNGFLDPWDYILVDREAEKKWEFSLKESLIRADKKKLLTGYVFQLMTNTATDVLKGAIEASGGKCVTKVNKNQLDKFVIVASTDNKAKYNKIKKQHTEIMVIEPEAIFDGVLRQELRFSKHLLS